MTTMTREQIESIRRRVKPHKPGCMPSDVPRLCDALLAEMEARDLDLQTVQALRDEVERLTVERDQIAADYHRASEDLDTLAQAILADPAVVPTAGETTATTAARVIGEVREALGTAQARIVELDRALHEYGQHESECYHESAGCVCGFAAALAKETP